MRTELDWSTIDGVVLDAVGTLIEPFPAVADVYAHAAERQGFTLAREEVKSRFSRYFRDDGLQSGLETDEAIEANRWRRIVRNVLEEVPDHDRAFEELWGYFGQPQAWRCFPDVAGAVDALSRLGRAWCVGSNFDSRLRTIAAGLVPLTDKVNSLVISSEVGFRKPHPAFYRAACEHLALPAERILWVGDDADNDVAGPTHAGMRAVLLDRRDRAEGRGDRVRDLTTLLAHI